MIRINWPDRAGCAALFYILYQLAWRCTRSAKAIGPDVHRAFVMCGTWTMVLWVCIPWRGAVLFSCLDTGTLTRHGSVSASAATTVTRPWTAERSRGREGMYAMTVRLGISAGQHRMATPLPTCKWSWSWDWVVLPGSLDGHTNLRR